MSIYREYLIPLGKRLLKGRRARRLAGFNHSISLITADDRLQKRLKHSFYGTYIIKCVALSLNRLQPKSTGLVPTLAM
jgi:hypothetical protein